MVVALGTNIRVVGEINSHETRHSGPEIVFFTNNSNSSFQFNEKKNSLTIMKDTVLLQLQWRLETDVCI